MAGQARANANMAVQRLKDIYNHEVAEASAAARAAVSEISGGVYDDVMDARRYLDQAIHRFEGLVRELLEFRDLVEGVAPEA